MTGSRSAAARAKATRRRRMRHAGAVTAGALLALVALVIAPAPGLPQIRTVIDQVKGMTEAEEQAFVRADLALGIQLANSEPTANAALWKRLSAAEKDAAIRWRPDVFGNLAGIDAASRDRANRLSLATRLTSAEAAAKEHPDDPRAQQVLKAYTAIHSAAGRSHVPRRSLVTLSPDQPPLATIAVGDLDTADVITYAVPGMGTYTDDMQLWAQSAQNIYDVQGEVGAPPSRAVVAWIGYVTPPPGIDATLGDYAARGAFLFAEAVRGLAVARADDPPDAVSVIAHSYGTTMVADALADNPDLGVYAFVMLGSAGIEDGIENAGALHARAVYAGEAKADPEARYGRTQRRDPPRPVLRRNASQGRRGPGQRTAAGDGSRPDPALPLERRPVLVGLVRHHRQQEVPAEVPGASHHVRLPRPRHRVTAECRDGGDPASVQGGQRPPLRMAHSARGILGSMLSP